MMCFFSKLFTHDLLSRKDFKDSFKRTTKMKEQYAEKNGLLQAFNKGLADRKPKG